MSHTKKSRERNHLNPGNPYNYNDERRPEHQQDRGPRYGNNRKMWARCKVVARRQERKQLQQEVKSEILD